jgi:hypothetical protein
MTKLNYFKLPEGKDVTVRILEPLVWHDITMTLKEFERYNEAIKNSKCPCCGAGIPFTKDRK